MDELIDDREVASAEDENEPEIIHEGEPGYEEKAEAEPEIDEPEEEAEPEITSEAPPKKRIPAKTRINQISRKYHDELRRAERAERELLMLKDENERLQRSYESSNKAVLSSQESMIDAHIQRAKQMKAKAIEEGDVESQLAADEALAGAVSDRRNLDAWKVQQKLYEESVSKQKPVQRQEVRESSNITPEAEDWVMENPWVDPDADDFDPDLHQKALTYSQHLDTRYRNSGRPEKIMSHEYFDEINRYMNKYLKPQSKQGELVMNRPRNTVAPVQRAHVPGHREVFRMSREEQDMARSMGWSDKQWLHYKKEAERLESAGRLKSAMGNSR